ncbi:Alpha/Beta hydrolase protein [Radiomyces spectabilis]|uniref:Alpha/Beta hydrolase protein n=1 Tax=Radiomyces spectabilis TaxID=64574 RepID=UPI00221EB0C3|nr:Alpha/Beta hydrolase protein [Radiomyces spectabilis]KAI8388860.1 Alpha/Beta hydrolase protein [Radiomyces spectabilis]
MLALITAFAATLYILGVGIFAFFTVCTLRDDVNHGLFTGVLRRFLFWSELFCSTLAEVPLHLIVMRLVCIKVSQLFGAFDYTLARCAYFIDNLTMFGLTVLFIESIRENEVVEKVIKEFCQRQALDSVASKLRLPNFGRLLNPVWRPQNVLIYPDISYATHEEKLKAIKDAGNDYGQPRKMLLDIYTSTEKSSGLRPVLVHVHGGAWKTGSKNIFYPHEQVLLSENNWVIVNIGYRLAPKNAYPTHLKDVKRALRWVKRNISCYGGDPDFVVLSGDSAGAHLAAMTVFTENDAQYQEGFEDVDTSVRGLISFSGALDISSDPRRGEFFTREVARMEKIDAEFLSSHSPIDLLEKAKAENKIVPTLLIAGAQDSLINSSTSEKFKDCYNKVIGSDKPMQQCTLLTLRAGHHISYISWSPRSFYVTKLIQTWCDHLYEKNK